MTLLASCAAFESYCRVFTADLQPDRIAEFLLVHPEFPYSVRYAVERMHASLEAIMENSDRAASGRGSSGSSAGCAPRWRSRRWPS